MSVPVRALAAAVAAGVLAAGGAQAEAAPAARPVAAPGTALPAVAPSRAATVLAGLSLPQRVGQLFMVGTSATGVDAATSRAITRYHVGNAMLAGRSHRGARSTAAVTRRLQGLTTSAATGGVRLFVATDQEGGLVQVLNGPGFSDIPTALAQGRLPASVLRRRAGGWGLQLRAAGVNVNLAPVLDTVPSARAARRNPPIGGYDREYGFTPERVASRGTAFAQGMRSARVEASVKHFPGLGRVTADTDRSAGVTDRVTVRRDRYRRPFAQAIAAGAPFVMMSSAYYARIDPRSPAVFSSTVIRGMLRTDLGFTGVVISDDLGSSRQVRRWPAGVRATRFLRAGGDMVLTVDPDTIPAMYRAVLAQAQADPAFRALVDRAALRVLTRKEAQGLTPNPR
jgi:beta-N-acetylhexosaminidase